MDVNYFYANRAGEMVGPVTLSQLVALRANHTIDDATRIAPEGGNEFVPFAALVLPESARLQLEQLSREVNRLRELYLKTLGYQKSDPEVALSQARKSAEAICKFIYSAEGLERGAKPAAKLMLDELIRALDAPGIVPKPIALSLGTIQAFGNFGTHDQGQQSLVLTSEHVEPCLRALTNVVEWYFRDYLHSAELLHSPKPAAAQNPSPHDTSEPPKAVVVQSQEASKSPASPAQSGRLYSFIVMFCGLLGWLLCFIPTIVAIPMGHWLLRKLKLPADRANRRRTIIGLVAAYLSFVVILPAIMWWNHEAAFVWASKVPPSQVRTLQDMGVLGPDETLLGCQTGLRKPWLIITAERLVLLDAMNLTRTAAWSNVASVTITSDEQLAVTTTDGLTLSASLNASGDSAKFLYQLCNGLREFHALPHSSKIRFADSLPGRWLNEFGGTIRTVMEFRGDGTFTGTTTGNDGSFKMTTEGNWRVEARDALPVLVWTYRKSNRSEIVPGSSEANRVVLHNDRMFFLLETSGQIGVWRRP